MRTNVTGRSGVFPIPVYTRPDACGGDCLFCPNTTGMPRSYVPNEDTLFAKSVSYSPAQQFRRFLPRMREADGPGDLPMEIVVLGGSFSHLDRSYREAFIGELHETMAEDRKPRGARWRWEESRYRCSVMTVECRPDQITPDECRFLRSLGVSKVELGVQHLEDAILEYNTRGHSSADTARATRLLKDGGFKVGYHVMLGLPGSSLSSDLTMVTETLWRDEYLPDYLKVYPCELLRRPALQPRLWGLYRGNLWRPLCEREAVTLLRALRESVPTFVRISRIQRQFADSILTASIPRGLMLRLARRCSCIRCREVGRTAPAAHLVDLRPTELRTSASGKDAHFELLAQDGVLVGLARLHRCTSSVAVLREIRIYGEACEIGSTGRFQGRGLGTALLGVVHRYARGMGIARLRINAPPGVRGFFRRCGYEDGEDGFLEISLVVDRHPQSRGWPSTPQTAVRLSVEARPRCRAPELGVR